MGCVSPVQFADDEFLKKVDLHIIGPTIRGIHSEQMVYNGFVFFGLMKVNDEPFVIEYNCRLGDPETEVVIPRLQNDLVEMFVALYKNELDSIQIKTDDRAFCATMAVSGGYPGEYEKGFEIKGLEKTHDDVIIFHAGTIQEGDKVITNGGRVLAATASGNTIKEAAEKSKNALKDISFEGMNYRKDIGYEF